MQGGQNYGGEKKVSNWKMKRDENVIRKWKRDRVRNVENGMINV